MQVDIKQIDPVTKELTITVEASQAQEEYRKYLEKSAKRIQIPGFRKGKAPLARVEREYKDSIVTSFMEDATDKYFGQAVIEHQIGYLAMPLVKDLKWEDEQDLVIVVEIEQEPEIELTLPEPFEVPYKHLTVESQVDYILEDTANKNRTFEQVDAAIEGDALNCSLTIIGQNDDEPVNVILYAGENPPMRSSNALLDRMVGDTVNISLSGNGLKLVTQNKFPELDNEMNYSCSVMINEIMRLKVPEINDDFAKDLGFDDLAALKQQLSDDLCLRIEHSNMDGENRAIIHKLYADKPFQLPERTLNYVVEEELSRLDQQQEVYRKYLEMQYRMEFSNQMISLYLNKALRKLTGFTFDESKMDEFIEHNAIMADMTVEAWTEQNSERIEDDDFIEQATNWFMLRDLAAKATFVDPPEPEETPATDEEISEDVEE
ncbi:MAG TPA: trigger factor [Candidatus Cloacimonadota bacterium]|nr:trigger factor [Candidatus Cloacimonadota bacterium]